MQISGMEGTIRIYETPFDAMQHVVAVFGDVRGCERVPTRIHREQPVLDLFGRTTAAKTWVEIAVETLKSHGQGVLMLLRQPNVDDFEAAPTGFEDHVEAPSDGEGHNSARNRMRRWREVGVGAQILRDLKVRSIREIATRERAYVGLTGFGIEVCGTILVKD